MIYIHASGWGHGYGVRSTDLRLDILRKGFDNFELRWMALRGVYIWKHPRLFWGKNSWILCLWCRAYGMLCVNNLRPRKTVACRVSRDFEDLTPMSNWSEASALKGTAHIQWAGLDEVAPAWSYLRLIYTDIPAFALNSSPASSHW